MTAAPDPAARLLDAEREATLARTRVSDTLAELQGRLNPRTLAQSATRQARDHGQTALRVSRDAGQTSVDAARRNPGAIAGIAAGLALFLARRPILRLFRRRHDAAHPAIPPTPPVQTADTGRSATPDPAKQGPHP